MDAIRIVLVEDDRVVRAAIATLLTRESDLEVVGELGHVEELPAKVAALHPHILILFVAGEVPRQTIFKSIQEIQGLNPELGIVALSSSELKTCVIGLLNAGVKGCLLTTDPPEMLAYAVRAVARGERWLSAQTIEVLVQAAAGANGKPHGILTEREVEVLRLMASGYRNPEIADVLHVTEQTVKNHVGNIYGKLSVRTRVNAVLYAISHGLVSSDQRPV